jgi:hypothetical protein
MHFLILFLIFFAGVYCETRRKEQESKRRAVLDCDRLREEKDRSWLKENPRAALVLTGLRKEDEAILQAGKRREVSA